MKVNIVGSEGVWTCDEDTCKGLVSEEEHPYKTLVEKGYPSCPLCGDDMSLTGRRSTSTVYDDVNIEMKVVV